jgi:hypothetical protein
MNIERLVMMNGNGIEYELSLGSFLDPEKPGVTRFKVAVNEQEYEYSSLGPAMTRFNAEVGQLVLAGAAIVGTTTEDNSATEGSQS